MFDRIFKRNSKPPQSNQPQPQPSGPSGKQSKQQNQPPLAPARKSPEDQRKDDLAAEGKTQIPLIADNIYKAMLAKAGEQTSQFLLTNKEAQALRESIKKAANKKVEDEIKGMDPSSGYSESQKSDAKKHALEQVQKAKFLEGTLKKAALDTVKATIKEDNKEKLEKKAQPVYDNAQPKLKMPLDKQKDEVKEQAEKEGQTESNSLLAGFVTQIKKDLAGKIKTNAAFLNGDIEADAIDTVGKELTERKRLDGKLTVDNQFIDSLYDNKLLAPIKQAVVMKLGYDRGFFSRTSDETKKFVKEMSDAAVNKVGAEIDTAVANDNRTKSSEVSKKYYGMMARVQASSLTKGSIQAGIEEKADEIAKKVLLDAKAKDGLTAAAQSSAYDAARVNEGDGEKISAASKKGAQIKAIELLKANQSIAVLEARKITKGVKEDKDKNIAAAPKDQTKRDEIAKKIESKIDEKDVAGKAVNQTLEADTLDGGFAKVGKIIDLAVPNRGDSAAFEFELKIPVEQSGSAYILFGLAAEAERDEKDLTVNSQFTFGAGFQTFGLDANFRAGLFLESKAKDSVAVMKLFSYGMYRQMRNISTTAAEYFWGQGGKSGMSKTEEAELWAAMIEQKHMKQGNYVDVGLMGKLQGDINAGVAKMGGEIGYKRLNHYDKETILDKMGGASNTTVGFGDGTDSTAAGLKNKADKMAFGVLKNANKHVIEAGATTEVKLGNTSVGFGLEGSLAFVNGKMRALEIAAKGSIPFAYGEDVAEWAKIASKWVTPIVGGVKNVVGLLHSKVGNKPAAGSPVKKNENKGLRGAGSVLDTGSDVLFTVPQFDTLGKGLAEKIQGDETINDTVRGWLTGEKTTSATEKANKVLLSSTLDLSLNFEKEWNKGGISKGWEIALEAAETKTFEVDAEVVKVSVEKSKSLGKLGFGMNDKGELEFKGGLLGFEN
ncbi:hypothetical protein [Cohnella sp. AR92]|uniref:hypothetical protein n=1 Tax=Cohnella sp. AR92 TaxID=648716 RepID=UPI000F8E3AE0|nr:hypothetical protein [Cohnella sp. AR92]RUS45913.1 hypothetical protein ELR57_15785 [Cohnella sp. AR92]